MSLFFLVPNRKAHRIALLVFAYAVGLVAFSTANAQEAKEASSGSTGSGGIAGTVFDRDSGRPLRGVRVTVDGTELSTVTGVDGAFRLNGVPVGSRTLTLSKDDFRPLQIEDLDVVARETVQIDTSLEGTATASSESKSSGDDEIVELEPLEVRAASALANSAEAFSALRREVNVSVDAISAQEIAKYAASDVSDVIIRMPGVSMASHGAFAVIRGLGERYNTTTMDSVVLPSSDPDRQNVELDQFPTGLIDGIVVYKNFSADLPGNLTGGGVEMKTLSFPRQRLAALTIGVNIDEGVLSGDDFLNYPTDGSYDWAGLGSRGRVSLADVRSIPVGTPIPPDGSLPIVPQQERMPVGPKFSFIYGDTFNLGGERSLGVVFGLNYNASFGTVTGQDGEDRPAFGAGFDADGHRVVVDQNNSLQDSYHYVESTEEVLAGLFAGLSFRLNRDHQVRLTMFSTQTGIDTAESDTEIVEIGESPVTKEILQVEPSFPVSETVERFRTHLAYRERNLTSLALSGRHGLPALHDLTINWSLARSTAYQEEPDNRTYLYLRPHNETQYELRQFTGFYSGVTRFWNRVDEDQTSGTLSLELPFKFFGRSASLSLGGSLVSTDRSYEEIYSSTGPKGPIFLVLEEPMDAAAYLQTQPLSASNVSLGREIDATFASLNLPISPALTFSVGLRREGTQFQTEGFGYLLGQESLDAFLHYIILDNWPRHYFVYEFPDNPDNGGPLSSQRNRDFILAGMDRTDLLPSAVLTFSPTSSLTFRAAYTETIARPSMREYSNYYTSRDFDTLQFGNSLLQLSHVRNADLRAEYFFTGTDLAALTLFYKEIENPIEKHGGVAYATADPFEVETWFNNPNTARVRGVEAELRKNFGFISDRLRGLTIGGNFTWIDAEVAPRDFVNFTGRRRTTEKNIPDQLPALRRLYDQPRWLANLDVSIDSERWGTSTTLAWVATDRVLETIFRDFDRYVERYERIDFTLRQRLGSRLSLKLAAKNLLDPERRLIRDTDQTGGIELVDRRWHQGRSYSVTTTYEF